MIYQAKVIYHTPVVSVRSLDWRLTVFNDDGDVRVIPQHRKPGCVWLTPADLSVPMPPAALCAFLEPDKLLPLADAVRSALKTK